MANNLKFINLTIAKLVFANCLFLLCACDVVVEYVASGDGLNRLPPNTPAFPHVVLGADNTTSSSLNGGNLYYPTQMIQIGTKLIATDSYNHRVLIWNQLPTSSGAPADVVLGQPTMNTRTLNFGGISNKSFNFPVGVASDGTKLAITDSGNSRVLIWNSIPTNNFKEADVVLGQPDFVSSTANNGGVGASSMNTPWELESANGNLMLADYYNRRVLVWNSFPTTNFAPASFVLGQASMTATVSAVTQSSIRGAEQIWSDGTKLLIVDYSANRILVWNTLPTGPTPADLVIGQANFTTATANAGGISAARVSSPWGDTSDGTKIVFSDSSNNRLLIWNSWPTVNGQAADVVWGQPNATANSANQGLSSPTALTLSTPSDLEYSGGQLFVADYYNHRMLVFNGIPTSNTESPVFVLGQIDLTSNRSFSTSITKTFFQPIGIHKSGSLFGVIDGNHSRVLIWTSPFDGVTQNPLADIVLGQPDLSTVGDNTGGLSAKSLLYPLDIHFDNNKVFVSDYYNCRVAIWNSLPNSFQDMDVVVGQLNKTTGSCATQRNRLNYPKGIFVANNKLVVTDSSNRVLLWNSIPTTDGANADIVLGQSTFTTSTANNGGLSSSSLSLGWSLADAWTDGTKLAVTDSENNRVLIWNSWPTVNKQAADLVLGQPNFTSSTANNGGIGPSTMSRPSSVHFDGSRFFVTDRFNHRVLVWQGWPQTNGEPADAVIGQTDFVSLTPSSNPVITIDSLDDPAGVVSDGNWFYRSELGLNRVIGIPISEILPF